MTLQLGWIPIACEYSCVCVAHHHLTAAAAVQETGWYDGQIFVKPPELLARDRLTGTYEVNPVMQRLRYTMAGTGAGLALCAVLLVGGIRLSADADGVYGRGAAVRSPTQV